MRILVVGAGPAGLTLAHAFEQAGLHDFVILERRPEVVIPEGNTLGLWPHCVRILDQLGLLDEANKIKTNLTRSCFLAPDGTLLQENNMHDRIEANHGHRFQLFSRKDFVKLLYDNAPRRSERILTNKEIVSIEQDDNGVKVSCSDDSKYEGDILIGADGVRSQVRRQLFNEDKETMPFTAEFKAVYGIGPTLPGLRVGDIVTTHGHGDSTLAFVGEKETYWFVFVKRDGPTQRWSRYSKEQEAELLDKYADVPLTSDGSVRVRDLRRAAKYTKLVDLEEGIIPKWYQGRIALLGDAVHKMTPYVALGINTGIESAVVLTNELRKLGEDRSTEAVALAFESYQQQRYERAKLCLTTSGNSCRMMAWPSWIVELVSRYVMPWFGAPLVARALAPIMRDSAVLDLVEEKNHKAGVLPWKFPRVQPYIKTG